MKTHSSHQDRQAQGFTLIELMVVIAVILVLASMTIGGLSFYKRKAAESKTEVFIASVSRALDDYRSDEGSFPAGDASNGSTTVIYDRLYGDGILDENGTVYLDLLDPVAKGSALNVVPNAGSYVLIDGWGTNLRYRSPGDENPDFDLWSYGQDGASGSEDQKRDDITNW